MPSQIVAIMITPKFFNSRFLLVAMALALLGFAAYHGWDSDGFRGRAATTSSDAVATGPLVNAALPTGEKGKDKSVPQTHSESQKVSETQQAGISSPAGTSSAPENLTLVTSPSKPSRNVSTRAEAAQGKSVPDMLRGADMSDPVVRARVVAEMEAHEAIVSKAVEDKAQLLGVPIRIDGPGHQISILYDFRGDEPIYRQTFNKNAAISSAANLLAPAPYNLDGSGIKVGVWDGGSIRSTHQEFTGGRVTKKNAGSAVADHATHVGGTIGAAGVDSKAKGMAPKVKIDSYDWYSDYAEMTAAGAATANDSAHIGLSNHSYGYGSITEDMGRYETECSTVDALVYSLPYYMPFWAAGNSQGDLTAKGGYQSITYVSLAKNILTVGAAEDAVSGGLRSPPAAVITNFSSLGPCDDGRIKPDVVGNGRDLYSSLSTNDTVYASYSGTSMATPNCMGSAALLEQLYAQEFSGVRMRASMMKALLIHTADDRGNAGPDYKYGWGLINVKAAADLILAHKKSLLQPKMIEGTITNVAKTLTHTFTWDGIHPIRATLCWTDPEGVPQSSPDSRTPNLVNNLDLKITAPDGTTVIQPYVMPFVGTWTQASMSSVAVRGKNNVDNVEQVDLASPVQGGLYTITVSLDGLLTNASQPYSLIITGGTDLESNQPPSVTLTSPVNGAAYLPGAPVTVSATATDLTVGGAPGAVAQVEFFSDTTSLGVDLTEPYTLDWTPPAGGTYNITAKATDTEGMDATSAAVTINILTGDGTPVITSFTPTSGIAGAAVVLTGENFVGVSSVQFNGSEAVFLMNSDGTITATLPASATTGRITVTNAYGTGISDSDFIVKQSAVSISQIYGAGGNTGATYNRDYVEIYNSSTLMINLSGWSVQYASPTSPSWSIVRLGGYLAPGKHYLIGMATGTSGKDLPTVDVSGTVSMNASSGKVALRSNDTLLTGFAPLDAAGLMDFVGYGEANAFEGKDPAPSPSTTTAIFRANEGATDTGDNLADFSTAPPNPRNSSAPAPVIPVITSSISSKGIVGYSFTYQITADNFPTSYSATGLPPGLMVDTATGLISGVPTAVVNANVTLYATNSSGVGTLTVDMRIYPTYSGMPATLFSENMGLPAASGAPVALYGGYQNSGLLTFAGTASVINDEVPKFPVLLPNGKVKIANTVGQYFEISGINTQEYTGLKLSFAHYKSTSASSNQLLVQYSINGIRYTNLAYTRRAGNGTAGTWVNITPTGIIPSTQNLRIRFLQTSPSATFLIDDVALTGTFSGGNLPVITTSGSLAGLDAIYGTASTVPSQFTVSGTKVTSLGIKITPPPGFEVSQTVGGSSGYAATQTVTGLGTILPKTIYVRLAAGTTAGAYSGNVICTSGLAAPSILPIPLSNVQPKLLIVTAKNRTKVGGATMALGTTAFTSSGLVPPQTMSAVTLIASGGTAAGDPAGNYIITPSAARGGNFDINNYTIDYVGGTLTVTPAPLTYAYWVTDYSVGGGNGTPGQKGVTSLTTKPLLMDTSANGDPDHDGITNLMEYFNGTHPGVANVNDITVSTKPVTSNVKIRGALSTEAEMLSMTYRRAKGRAGFVTGIVKWSYDPAGGEWSADGVTEISQDMGTYENVTATVVRTPGEPAKFMRLEVTLP